ncbi:hypothetical protein GCM10010129_42540 [Streptomyces fumigatiscleroticus]|nr:hypothetical protein GCM10010129_42540 [Streptomyces fumigatiscleroticus]
MRIRAAVTETPGGPFVVQDLEMEAPRPREVLVRITAAGLCHTDLGYQARWPRRLTPMVFGHEGAGVVEAVGTDVTGLAPGDHVCRPSTVAVRARSARRAIRPTATPSSP